MRASIAIQHPDAFWPNYRWPQFDSWENKEKTLIYVPTISMTDWGMGFPLDAEEVLVMSLLKAASERKPTELSWLYLPPASLVAGPHMRTAFPVNLDLAYDYLHDLGKSIAASGFRKIVFINANPWMEDIIDATGRDLRIALDLQMFCVNLSGLQLNFHPDADRARLNAVLRHLFGEAPAQSTESQSNTQHPGILQNWNVNVKEPIGGSGLDGKEVLDDAVDHFIRLSQEIYNKAPIEVKPKGVRP